MTGICGAVNYDYGNHTVRRVCTQRKNHTTTWHGDDKYLWPVKDEERQDLCSHVCDKIPGRTCQRPKDHYDGTSEQRHGSGGIFWSNLDGHYEFTEGQYLKMRADVVPPNPLRDKMMSQKTEIRRLNDALARLSNLARGRLERSQLLTRQNNRLVGENHTLRQERDSYQKLLEEANQKLSESGYFIGLGEHND